MKRYCIVYLDHQNDPGTDYAWGKTLLEALQDFDRRIGFAMEVLSITKVRG